MLVFLKINGIRMNLTNVDIIHAGLSVTEGSMKYGGVLEWIQEHRA